MSDCADEEVGRYAVVVNDEVQYSIWPTGRAIPCGWRSTGVSGSKAECLAHIERDWTDMRPASLRCAGESDSPMPTPGEGGCTMCPGGCPRSGGVLPRSASETVL
jgi:MbtH protein